MHFNFDRLGAQMGFLHDFLRKSELFKRLWNTLRRHRVISLWWLLCNLGGGLSPTWLALFFRHFYGKPPHWFEFVLRGDLALLAAAFLAPSVFQVLLLFKKEQTTLGIGAVVLAGIGSVLSAVLYSSTNPETISPGATGSLNRFFLGSWSVFLLSFSVLFSFVTFLNDRHLEIADLDAVEARNENRLKAEVMANQPENAPAGEPVRLSSESVTDDIDERQNALKNAFKAEAGSVEEIDR